LGWSDEETVSGDRHSVHPIHFDDDESEVVLDVELVGEEGGGIDEAESVDLVPTNFKLVPRRGFTCEAFLGCNVTRVGPPPVDED
jgi:hypothetical protein